MVEASHTSVMQAAGDISESLVTEQSLVPVSQEIPTESPEPPVAPDSVKADHGVAPVQEGQPPTTHSYTRLDYASMHTGRTAQQQYGLHITVNKALNKLGRKALKSMVTNYTSFTRNPWASRCINETSVTSNSKP